MSKKKTEKGRPHDETPRGATEGGDKQPFTRPKLTYIPPKLVKHGEVKKLTAGFFGPFSP